MKTYSWALAAAALALTGPVSDAAEPSASAQEVPAEIVAMLKEHLGKWRTEGQWISNGDAKPTKATWECKAAVGGIGNVCTWNHEWADRPPDAALEIMGYDPKLKTMSITRVTDTGLTNTAKPSVHGKTMTVRWESTQDGKRSVGFNEVIVKAPGEWIQRMTIDMEGKRVTEMNVTHHRVP